ncbi:MAG: tyrosine-type recombinase/integrase, partial [Planctomycetaceae bacterium]|nr:tyrosine-type recombinase/integrase [Planctomycetaceae bacterium]
MSQSKRRARKARRCTRIRIGRVSLYEHHGAWWVYYRQHDKPIRRRVSEDQASAERIAAELNSQLTSASPLLLDFVPISVADLQRKFLEHHEQVLRSSVATINRYRTATQHFVDYAGSMTGAPDVHEISATAFVGFLRARRVSPNGHGNTAKRCLRDKGVQFIVEVCRSMLALAQRRRHLPPYAANPFSDVRTDRMRIEDAKLVFVFDADTELQFLNAAHDWEFAIHFTLAKTGMRPGELCHLLIEEVDLANGWIHVRNKPELGWSVKTRNERNVPLVSEVCDVLRHAIGGRSAGVVFRRPRFVVTDSCLATADRDKLRQ